MSQRMTRTQQGNEVGGIPLASTETVWMGGLEHAIKELKRLNPDVSIECIHSIETNQGEWHVGLRCGPAGVSYTRIVLDYGYHLEWID